MSEQIIDPSKNFDEINRIQMQKLTLNDENEQNQLLAYYKERLNDYDKEQTERIENLVKLQFQQEEYHKKELEMLKQNEKVLDLERCISELKVSLFEEKQQNLNQQRELDQQKLSSNDDNKKILYLQNLCDPAEEQVVVQKDLRPIMNHKLIKNELNIVNNSKQLQSQISLKQTQDGQCQGRTLVKTIYLPNEKANEIVAENQQLQVQIQNYKDLLQQDLDALKEQLAVCDDESKLRSARNTDRIQQLKERNDKLEKDLASLSRDYFAYRNWFNEQENKNQEEKELLKERNNQLNKKLSEAQRSTLVENQVSKELADKKNDEYVDKFRNQIANKEETLGIIKNQYGQAQKIYLKNIQELEDTLAKLAEKYNRLEQKRRLEITECQHQNRVLKERLQDIQDKSQENIGVEEDDEQKFQGSTTKKFDQNENDLKKKKTQKKQLLDFKKKSTKNKQLKKTMKKKINQEDVEVEEDKQKENIEQNANIEEGNNENYQEGEDEENNNNDDDDQSESLRSQDIENINKQLIELEKQMDIAKKH